MTPFRRVLAATLAQALGQALALWAVIAHVIAWPAASVFVVGFLVTAVVVPLRHDGTLPDRAMGNFIAAAVCAAMFFRELLYSGIDVIAGSGFTGGTAAIVMLCAAVMFTTSGAFFWGVAQRQDAS